MMRPKPFAAAAAVDIMLTGCTVGPDYHPPNVQVPQHFVSPPSMGAAPQRKASMTAASPPAVDLASWWKSFHDPELESLVGRAMNANLDLQMALQRVQEARTGEAVVTGEALPSLDASAGGGWGTGQDPTRSRVAGPLRAGENALGLDHIRGAVGFDTIWEIDLFGKFRREIEAAHYDAQAAIAARNDVLITVVADVARAYLDLRGVQMQLAVARQSVATARRTLDFVQTRYERGLTNEMDVTLAKRELMMRQAVLAPLTSQIEAAEYSIAALLGEYPGSLATELQAPAAIPALPTTVDAGLPLDLVRRRPDIHEAERGLAAATARIGVATADLFPSLAVTGGAGLQSPQRAAGGNFIGSIGPSLSAPILDFGTLDAVVEVADLRARELLLNYKQTIIRAVQQVDTTIVTYSAQLDRLGRLNDALAASQRAVTLATERYDRGLTDFLNVLDAERTEFALETDSAVAETTAADDLVSFYKALGGGWESNQSLPPIRQPQPAVVAAFQRLLTSEDAGP